MQPKRCCIACRSRKDKNELFRIVSDENGNAILDRQHNINSRGIYLCKDKKCINSAIKAIEKNRMNLKIKINNESILEVLKELGEEIWEN